MHKSRAIVKTSRRWKVEGRHGASAAAPIRRLAAVSSASMLNSPHGLRLCAIDIGTNSLHMMIVEVTASLAFRTLSSQKELTQLGRDALVKHVLTRSAMNHTVAVLGRFLRVAQSFECDQILTFATSAVRESSNGGDFIQLVKEQLGLDVRIISSQEEARLIYLAVRQAINFELGSALVVDIGGGSAEFILAQYDKALMLESRKLGASRLTQAFLAADPPAKSEMKKLRMHVHKVLSPLVRRLRAAGPQQFVGTSGTMENIASMCAALHGEQAARDRVANVILREDFEVVFKRLAKMSLRQRESVPGLDPARAYQITAGYILVDYLFDELKISQFEVSDRAMREGMIIDYMQTHWPKVRLSVEIMDPRRRGVVELGRRCNFDEAHALGVAKLAVQMFDQLGRLHQLDQRYRELLEYAAMLHDTGWHIGHSGHHKHSWYLIKNGDLTGFSPQEIDLIAVTARYHRRSMPKKSHEAYMLLAMDERRIVEKLAAILRVAEALDRGHYQCIDHVRCTVERHTVRFATYYRTDPELELWAARLKADMFEKVFNCAAVFAARKGPSALSQLPIRIDGGPGGYGREARRMVYGDTH